MSTTPIMQSPLHSVITESSLSPWEGGVTIPEQSPESLLQKVRTEKALVKPLGEDSHILHFCLERGKIPHTEKSLIHNSSKYSQVPTANSSCCRDWECILLVPGFAPWNWFSSALVSILWNLGFTFCIILPFP